MKTVDAPAPRWAWWLATGFGSGYLKPAPGTWGTLAGLIAWVAMVIGVRALGRSWGAGILFLAPLVITALGIWVANTVVKETGQKDPSFIVVDEWAGIWFALTPLLFTVTLQPQPWSLWAARLVAPFMLFRLFDIWKPGIVDTAQSLPGGYGVVMDDVLAGLLAAFITLPLDQWLGAQSLLHPGMWR
jgi:phosphatidylglycerophosphatase A